MTTNTSILLVDDDIELTALLRDYLAQEGFTVGVAHNGEDGVRGPCPARSSWWCWT